MVSRYFQSPARRAQPTSWREKYAPMRHKNFRTFRNVDAQEITRAMMRRVLIGDSEIVLRDYAAFERASGERARLASRASRVPRNALRTVTRTGTVRRLRLGRDFTVLENEIRPCFNTP